MSDENKTKCYRVEPGECPKCKAVLDGSTSSADNTIERGPEPEDVTVCFYCGALLVFTKEMTLREMKVTEFRTLDPKIKMSLIATMSALNELWKKNPRIHRGSDAAN